jgi:hypothetical protein
MGLKIGFNLFLGSGETVLRLTAGDQNRVKHVDIITLETG